MKYSPEQLQAIEQLAAICTKPTEIAISIEVPEEQFKSDISIAGNPARNAYIKGKLSTKTEIRKQMVMLARVGSPAAVDMLNDAILDMEDDE
ncbi:MAG: hypothetical protein K2G13_05550 [Muribaculaceae bacterium]|nr:hypothetical protein [Muribaculaceae bacterium]